MVKLSRGLSLTVMIMRQIANATDPDKPWAGGAFQSGPNVKLDMVSTGHRTLHVWMSTDPAGPNARIGLLRAELEAAKDEIDRLNLLVPEEDLRKLSDLDREPGHITCGVSEEEFAAEVERQREILNKEAKGIFR